MSATRQQFEEKLQTVRDRVLEMGRDADRMVDLAMRALIERDVVLVEQIIDEDDTVDGLDLQIEALCMGLIALQQPMARDLRLIGTALKVITDLERIGDHAVDIAKVARKLAHDPPDGLNVPLPAMAALVRRMLQDALTAFVEHDLALVRRVVADDDEVDRLFHEVRGELHSAMQHEPSLVVGASYLLFVAHYLERIGDHIVNIAERVNYIETGQLEQLAKSGKTTAA